MAQGAGGTAAAAAAALLVSFGIAVAAPGDRSGATSGDAATARSATAGEATEPAGTGSEPGASGDEDSGSFDLVDPAPDGGSASEAPPAVPAEVGQVAGQRDTARGQLAAARLDRARLAQLGLGPINGVDAPPPDRIGTIELPTPFYLLPASERYNGLVTDTGWVSGQVQYLQGAEGRVSIRTWAHVTPAGAARAFDLLDSTPLGVEEPSVPADRGERARLGRGRDPGVAVLVWTRRDLLIRIEARPGPDGRVLSRRGIDRVADAVDRSLDRHPSMRGGPLRRADEREQRRAAARALRATLPVATVERLGLRVDRLGDGAVAGAVAQRRAMAANALDVDPDALLDARFAAVVRQRLVREDPVRVPGTVELRVLAFPSAEDAARGFRTVAAVRGPGWRAGGRSGDALRRDYGPARDLLWRRGDLLLHLRVTDRSRRPSQVAALERRVADAVDARLGTRRRGGVSEPAAA